MSKYHIVLVDYLEENCVGYGKYICKEGMIVLYLFFGYFKTVS